MAQIEVRGLKGLQRALQELPKKIERRALNAALMKGAQPMVKAAKSRAPVLTGALRYAVRAKPVSPKGHAATVVIGITGAKQVERKNSKGRVRKVWVRAKNFVFYWLFQEFGTGHQPARPFMRPAFETNKVASVGIIKNSLAARIAVEAEKLRK